jgi:hypothetical protein
MLSNPATIVSNQQLGLMGQRMVGEVVEHHPEKHGLVRVRIRGIHDNWPKDCLPWQQGEAGFGHGNDKTTQMKPIPPVGAKVYSKFLSNNQFHATYGDGPSSDDKKVDEFTKEGDYPNVYGSADHGGHKEVVNTKEGEESWTRSHIKGTSLGIDKDGNLNHTSAAGVNHTGKSVNMKSSEGTNIEGQTGHFKFGGKLIIEASEIEFRHGSAKTTTPILPGAAGPQSPTAPTLPTAGTRPSFSPVGDKV